MDTLHFLTFFIYWLKFDTYSIRWLKQQTKDQKFRSNHHSNRHNNLSRLKVQKQNTETQSKNKITKNVKKKINENKNP